MVALIIGWTSEIRCVTTKYGMEGIDMWNGRGKQNHGYGWCFFGYDDNLNGLEARYHLWK